MQFSQRRIVDGTPPGIYPTKTTIISTCTGLNNNVGNRVSSKCPKPHLWVMVVKNMIVVVLHGLGAERSIVSFNVVN